MPLYGYACMSCNRAFDEHYSISDRDLPCDSPCVECGGKVERDVTGGTIVSGIDSLNKIPSQTREVLRNIKKGAPGSKMRDF